MGYIIGSLSPALLMPILFEKSSSYAFHPFIALTAVGASVIIGVTSILLPVQRAVQLDPLEAL